MKLATMLLMVTVMVGCSGKALTLYERDQIHKDEITVVVVNDGLDAMTIYYRQFSNNKLLGMLNPGEMGCYYLPDSHSDAQLGVRSIDGMFYSPEFMVGSTNTRGWKWSLGNTLDTDVISLIPFARCIQT